MRELGSDVLAPAGRVAAIVAPVAGVVRRLNAAAIGTRVSRGTALLNLVPLAPVDRDLRAQSTQAVASAAARLAAAEARAERATQLARDRAGSQRAAEEALADRDVARASLAAARVRADRVLVAPLESDVTMAVRAPLDGALRQLLVADGQVVAAATPLAEVTAVDGLWVRVPVFAGDLSELDPTGDAVVHDLAGAIVGPARPVVGPLTADPTAATVDRYYAVETRAGALRPGERVAVRVPLREEVGAVVVPAGAVVSDVDGGTWVYEVARPGVYVRRRVAVARSADGSAVLARGIAEGTTVVIVGAAELWGTEFGAGH